MQEFPIVKSFSVGDGDMFYISHGTSNFTVIDCYLEGDRCSLSEVDRERILNELFEMRKEKRIARFISTHPDEDHIGGIKLLEQKVNIENFYCTENSATKVDPSDSFKRYMELRKKATWIYTTLRRKWLNICDERAQNDPGNSCINFLWPIKGDSDFEDAQKLSKEGKEFNNLSPIIHYNILNGPSFLWFGDMEEDFMTRISKRVNWRHADIIFAPHHGRDSGKIPEFILKKISPCLIIIGEAPSKDLNYYAGYYTITQNTAGDITFKCVKNMVEIYVSNEEYEFKGDILYHENTYDVSLGNYVGTLFCGG